MNIVKKGGVVAIGTAVVLALWWLAFNFFGIQALFGDTVVDEVIPVSSRGVENSNSALSVMPSTLQSAIFQTGDSTYSIEGEVIISEIETGGTVSLKDFRVTNGPDLYVYLVDAEDGDNASVKAAVDAGKYKAVALLKGNVGNQSYVLPEGLDTGQYNVVSIWCQRFSRNFGHAVLR